MSLSPPGAGILFLFVLGFFFGVLFSFSSTGLGRHSFLWLSAKGNVPELPRREETRLGWSPNERCCTPSPSPHPPCTVLGAQGAIPPRLCPPLSWVCSVPLLACTAYIGPVATWSFMKSGRVEVGGHGGHCWEGRRSVSGSMPVSVLAPDSPSRGATHFRAITRVPPLEGSPP